MAGSPSSRSSKPAAIRTLRNFGQRRTLVGFVAAFSGIALAVVLLVWNGKIWLTIANGADVSLLLGMTLLLALFAGAVAVISLWRFLQQIQRRDTRSEKSLPASTVSFPIIPERPYPLVVPLLNINDSPPWPTTQQPIPAPRLPALPFVPGAVPPNCQTLIASLPAGQLANPPIVQQQKKPYALANIQSFILPKEGEAPENCQDRYAFNRKLCRFAVADGVSQSFVPGGWAQIIATDYVNHSREFLKAADLVDWLRFCSSQWREWIETDWMEGAVRKRQEERSGLYDEKEEARREQIWREDIKALKRSGAQATLIGCVIEPHMPARNGLVDVHVFSVGDANFFLFQQKNDGDWKYAAFPNTSPTEFTSKPFTLTTLEDQMIQAWNWKKNRTFRNVHPGDYIVLASDALAKWLLIQIREKGVSGVLPFIMNTDHDLFKEQVDKERRERRLEDDDVTMLVIPVQAVLRLPQETR